MEKNNKNTLGGFDAILDSFIPNVNKTTDAIVDIDDSMDDDELEDIKNNSTDPIIDKIKKEKGKSTKIDTSDVDGTKDDNTDDSIDDTDDDTETQKSSKQKKVTELDNSNKEDFTDDNDTDSDTDSNIVSDFFDAIAEKLGWEIGEDEQDSKPKDVDSLIKYFQDIIEEESKPTYASEEVEALDNFVKQGGDIKQYLQIDAELDLEDLDIEDETNQKLVVKQFLKEKGISSKQIEKKIAKYEEAGLLEDEAQDALESLKEIKEEKKEQLLLKQKKEYEQVIANQQKFYNNVVSEIKGLKNIRGITVPEKDKKVLIDYILKPDTDGKTKYQKDYAKGGVKNLIESAYFTMNADKLLEAAKKAGSNSAIDRFKNSLKTTSVNTRSKQISKSSDDEPIWSNIARKLRIS